MPVTTVVLHHLAIKGIADAAGLARCAGLDEVVAAQAAQELVAVGLAVERSGRVSGFSLTQEGRARHAAQVADDPLRARRGELEGWYLRFEAVNARFKQLCTDWQLVDGERPNDHADAAYDEAVLVQLASVHAEAAELLAETGDERLSRYAARLADAALAVSAGEVRRFTAPLCESYHDIWMELHHDLLTSFGRARSAADA